MAALTVFSAAVCLATVLLLSQPQSSDAVDEHLQNVAKASNKFALDMYRRLIKSDKDNIVFSPFSISSALAMTLLGAKGKSAAQLKKLLHLTDLDEEWVHPSYRTLLEKFNDKRGPVDNMLLAGKIFLKDDFSFLPNFISETKVFYDEPDLVKFGKDLEGAREHINTWMEAQAGVPDLVASDALEPKTLMVLASGMRFKKLWANKFPKDVTRSTPFYRSPTDVLTSEIMIQHGMFQSIYDQHLLARIVELPFDDGERNMVIFFPSGTTPGALEEMESKLNYSHFEHVHHVTKLQPMDVLLPKFSIEDTLSLEEILNPMGLRTVFSSEKSDLSKMSKKALHISQFLHKSSIEVTEDGVKLTTIDELPTPRERFVAMRPFLFYIEDVPTGAVIMMGRVKNPANDPTEPPTESDDAEKQSEAGSEAEADPVKEAHDEL